MSADRPPVSTMPTPASRAGYAVPRATCGLGVAVTSIPALPRQCVQGITAVASKQTKARLRRCLLLDAQLPALRLEHRPCAWRRAAAPCIFHSHAADRQVADTTVTSRRSGACSAGSLPLLLLQRAGCSMSWLAKDRARPSNMGHSPTRAGSQGRVWEEANKTAARYAPRRRCLG